MSEIADIILRPILLISTPLSELVNELKIALSILSLLYSCKDPFLFFTITFLLSIENILEVAITYETP